MNFDYISPPAISYFCLAGIVVLCAWWGPRQHFPTVHVISSLGMVASWTTFEDAIAFLVFLLTPYIIARHLWGQRTKANVQAAYAVVALQVFLFLVFKGYEWFDFLNPLGISLSLIGISYVMFRQIHLVLDAPFMGKYDLNFIHYLSYLLSLWTLIAGPIQRYDDYMRGMATIARPDEQETLQALHRIVNGLLKAFIAAPLFLPSSDITTLEAPGTTWVDVIIVFYSYPLYLYLNFAGYTDVMIGLARLCGCKTLPENFNRPYLARNVAEFWGRWHMSLGVWVRSYIFTPLSRTLVKYFPENAQMLAMAIAIMVTFFVVGIWHGTTSNFAVFGFVQGLGVIGAATWTIIIKQQLGRSRAKVLANHRLYRWLATFLCFHYMCASFLLLSNSVADINRVFRMMIT